MERGMKWLMYQLQGQVRAVLGALSGVLRPRSLDIFEQTYPPNANWPPYCDLSLIGLQRKTLNILFSFPQVKAKNRYISPAATSF